MSSSFWTGTPGQWSQQSVLSPGQQSLQQQLLNSAMGRGGTGAFGSAADYYRDLLSNDPAVFDQFAAPEMRRFREEIIPGLAEQFAGMGSGGLSSSGFRNAAVNAGSDLSERLGAIRANLKQQGAQGLFSLGQQGLNPTVENVYTAGQPGFLDSLSGLVSGGVSGLGGLSSSLFSLFGKRGGPGGSAIRDQIPGYNA